MNTNAYAATDATSPLAPFQLQRRDPGPHDVEIKILFCGVCHSDVHTVRNEWQGTTYPCVPGHEIIGRVTRVGGHVERFKEGDIAGVGCLVDSCRTCASCKEDLEQFCEQGAIFTYNAPDRHSGGLTYGGYSENIVVDEAFVLTIPENLDRAGAAPLLCAGITTYSPLKHNNVTKGQKVGVVGLGGLGHMGVKLAKAFGAHVVVFTTSPDKMGDALRLGADEVVHSKDEAAMKKHLDSFHFILDTVAAKHDINAYLVLLRRDGTLTQVGVPSEPLAVDVSNLIFGRRNFSGSLIGGLKETQEMLDFCGLHAIISDIELIPIQKVNEAYDRLVKGDVRYRFVIDMASLDPAKVPAGLVMIPKRHTMDDDPPQAEKNFGEDMKAFERQPVRSKELELLQHQAEKATGPEGVAIDAKIREKAKQGEQDPLPIAKADT